MLKAGAAAVLPQPSNPTPHLWIALTDADNVGCAVIVNVTTLRAGADQTVLLGPGDHSFLHHESFVSFQDATIANVALLEKRIQEIPNARHERSCSPELLAKLIDGALRSPYTPRKVKKYLMNPPAASPLNE